jgi:hypothetical protein
VNQREQLFRLTDAGKRKLDAELNPAGRQGRARKSITVVNRRTLAKIEDGEGVRRGRIIALFKFLRLEIEDADFEAVFTNGMAATDSAALADQPLDSISGDPSIAVSAAPVGAALQSPFSSRRFRFRIAAAVGAFALLTVFGTFVWRLRLPPKSPDPDARVRLFIGRVIALRKAQGRDSDAARKRSDLCVALAEDAVNEWYGPKEQERVEQIDRVSGDISLSLEWLGRHDKAKAVQLSGALARYWYVKGRIIDNEKWLALAEDDGIALRPRHRAQALIGLSLSMIARIDTGLSWARRIPVAYRGRDLAKRAYDVSKRARWLLGQANSLRLAGLHMNALYQIESARSALDESQNLYTTSVDKRGIALIHLTRSFCSLRRNDGDRSHFEMATEASLALRQFREIGNRCCEQEASKSLMENGRCLPARAETSDLMKAVESECRRQIQLSYSVPVDFERRHEAWRQLARMARLHKNSKLEKECLLGLWESRSDHYGNIECCQLLGACRRHCSEVPGYRSLPLSDDDFANQFRGTPEPERQNLIRALEEGGRMTLDQAAKLALHD